jgi:uncharacterized protein
MQPSEPLEGELKLLDAYGDGGFRVEGLFRPGSILLLPGNTLDWSVSDIDAATPEDFGAVLAIAQDLEFLLVGCGTQMQPVSAAVRAAFEESGIGLELMGTGSACRTYNHLISEGHTFGAALIAVD